MSQVRFGVSLDENVLKALDTFVESKGFPSRSQAIRFLVEKNSVENQVEQGKEVAGAIIFIYDHHKNDINTALNHIQHDYYQIILSNLHFHINHDNCMEIIAVKGEAKLLKELSEKIFSIKGVAHGDMVISKGV